MKILIAGDGETAMHLAGQLSNENQDVVIVSHDIDRLAVIDTRYNVMTHCGSVLSPRGLMEAGVNGCDMFIAVTADEKANIISCQLAKSLGARRTVARIDSAEFVEHDNKKIFRDTGVDVMVFPELLASDRIAQALQRPWVYNWFELHGGALIVAGVRLDDDFMGHGVKLKDFASTFTGLHVCAIKRGAVTIIPNGNDVLYKDDIAYFSILEGDIDRLMVACGKSCLKIARVMISGGGKMARHVAAALMNKYNVTIVESDRELSRQIALDVPRVTVVNADQRDIMILKEEGIDKVDAFIALNDSSEKNIVACMLARESGVKYVMADIEDIQYFVEAEALNIDTVINKKLITSSNIFQLMLDSQLSTPRCLALEDAEVMEVVVDEGARITRSCVKDLSLPSGMTIAGLIRGDKGIIVKGDTIIKAGDHLVVFCLSGTFNKIGQLFSKRRL